jgi:hypothetical protein
LVEAGEIQKRPEQLRTKIEQQILTVEADPCRCLRCGNHVYPIVNMPGPYLCGDCCQELKQRDQQEVPGCKWWGELLQSIRDRNQPKETKE